MEFSLFKKAQTRRLTLEEIRLFPKCELHLHLDGSIRTRTVLELAAEQGVTLPTTDPVELHRMLTVPIDCKNLVEYLRPFDIVNKVLQKTYALKRAVFELAEDCSKDSITYLEIRFAPILHTLEGLSYSEVLHAVVEGKLLAEYNIPIVIRIIVCAMRHMGEKDSYKFCFNYILFILF
jgi:adenosine deaminase